MVLGLVLYLGWILVVVQPDLARRLMLPQTPKFQQRVALHREQVQGVLRAAVAAHGFGLHSLMVAEWDGASSLKVLAVQGRTLQLPLQPGEETLVGVAMAKVMGHVVLGLGESERTTALSIDEVQLPPGATLLVCPVGCALTHPPRGLLVAIHEPLAVAPRLGTSGARWPQGSGMEVIHVHDQAGGGVNNSVSPDFAFEFMSFSRLR